MNNFRVLSSVVVVLLTFAVVSNAAPGNVPSIEWTEISNIGDTRISSAPFSKKTSTNAAKQFEFIEGSEIGLTKGFQYTIRDYPDPFWFGRGTASGDFDRDGWQDIVLGSDHGFYLYKNIGGRFELQQQPNSKINKLKIFAVALVDLNNDGWLDLFFTTFNNGNYLIKNNNGNFDYDQLISVPNNNGVLTISPAFADLDGNAQLDIVNGNIALGVVTGFYHMAQRRNNSVVFNQNLKFNNIEIETSSGETMASLISDINNDGIADIYFGNDFTIPDKILLGTGKGYEQVVGNKLIPFTPFFSMGADTGDINNDLTLDFVVTGTMYMAPFVGESPIDGKTVAEYSAFKGGVETCESIKDARFKQECQRIRKTKYLEKVDAEPFPKTSACEKMRDDTEKELCLTRNLWKLTTKEYGLNNCKKNFKADDMAMAVCEILQLKGRRFERQDLYGGIPQDDRNMLYRFNNATKSFSLVTEFKHPGGWTWNSKIVDIDNDGWQDVVSSDGTIRRSGYGWNVWMKNIDGSRFEQRQFTSGFATDFGLYSFALIDMDNDGDLDMVGNSAEAPVQVFRNNAVEENRSIAVSLVDKTGNHDGVGAKIIISHNNSAQSQIREIKASGGYMSFDPMIAYFGLGNTTSIDEIRVQWRDGKTTSYRGPFASGHHYRIERTATSH